MQTCDTQICRRYRKKPDVASFLTTKLLVELLEKDNQ